MRERKKRDKEISINFAFHFVVRDLRFLHQRVAQISQIYDTRVLRLNLYKSLIYVGFLSD